MLSISHSTLFPYTTLFRSNTVEELFKQPKTKTASKFINSLQSNIEEEIIDLEDFHGKIIRLSYLGESAKEPIDRKSTRLNSSHVAISYAVFCLKKKKKNII